MIGAFLLMIAVGLVAGLAGGLLSRRLWPAGAVPNKTTPIRTTNLALVDDQGRERSILALVNGRPMLLLSDEHDLPSGDRVLKPRLAVGILDDGAPGLELTDVDGKKRVSLTIGADGLSTLELTARNGKSRATLSAPADGPTVLDFSDESGTCIAKWP